MRTVEERERKYELPAGAGVADLVRGGVVALGEPAVQTLDAVYYDTSELRLTRAALALRRRTGGDDAGWHLKVGAAGATRTEHQRALTDDSSPPADLIRLVRAASRGRPVEPVARVETRRRQWPVTGPDGNVRALVADDAVVGHDLVDGRRIAWHEIEVELVEGDDDLLDTVDRRLRKAGARPVATAKVRRVLGDRLREVPPASDGAAGVVSGYAAAARDALVANDPGARDGVVDPVHDMRVAVRRLRSTFRTFRALWEPAAIAHVRAELSWLGARLGAVRDAQVMRPRLEKAVDRLAPVLVRGPVAARIQERFAADEAAALTALRRALGSRRYLDLLTAVDTLVEAETTTGTAVDVGPGWVDRRIHKAVRRADGYLDTALERQATAGVSDDDPALHEARKAYKRARYAVEVRTPRVKALKRLQDLLGDHQDSVVTRQALLRLANEADSDTFTYGLLYGEQEAAGRRLVHRLPEARTRTRRKLRRWLE